MNGNTLIILQLDVCGKVGFAHVKANFNEITEP